MPKEGVAKLTMMAEELERSLETNIGMLAKGFIRKGYDPAKMDAAAQDCRDHVAASVASLGVEDENDRADMASMFVMIMMHTACKDSLNMMKERTKRREVPLEVVVGEKAAEMAREVSELRRV